MTKRENLTVFEVQHTAEEFVEEDIGELDSILSLMYSKRIEKIPVITKDNRIIGLITRKDLERSKSKPLANKDADGQLLVAAAIGANKEFMERAKKLILKGCNALVVDVANGHSQIAIDAVTKLKDEF